MILRVEWLQSALTDLAALWVQADSGLRQAITAAADVIDHELGANPDAKGESREEEERVFFVYPLGVQFEVQVLKALVRVLHVWDIRRRKP